MSATAFCRLCSNNVQELINFGNQPFGNKYYSSKQINPLYPKILGYCKACGLIQIIKPAPVNLLRPNVNWIKFNEPEEHLKAVSSKLIDLLPPNANYACLSPKDYSLGELCSSLGMTQSWQLPFESYGPQSGNNSIANIQAYWSQQNLRNLQPVSLLLCRHILEHVHDLKNFFKNILGLIKPNGYALIEVPTCEQDLEQNDYAKIWEEHTQYFTANTFQTSLNYSGFSIVWLQTIKTIHEHILVCLVKKGLDYNAEKLQITNEAFNQDLTKVTRFASSFLLLKQQLQKKIIALSSNNKIALFGASHLGLNFINIMDLSEKISFLYDDNSNKQNKLFSNLACKITPSENILNDQPRLCLLAVNQALEDKIINEYSVASTNKIIFLSIFPQSKYWILGDNHV